MNWICTIAPGRLGPMDTEHTPDRCPRCGWDQRDPYEIVSRHPTSAGVVVYTRCACGLLSTWLSPAPSAAGRLVVRGARPAGPQPCRG